MTVVAAAASALGGGANRGPRLATPGAVLLFAGLALLWWGLGVFRGEASQSTYNMSGPIPKDGKTQPLPVNATGGGGGQKIR